MNFVNIWLPQKKNLEKWLESLRTVYNLLSKADIVAVSIVYVFLEILLKIDSKSNLNKFFL